MLIEYNSGLIEAMLDKTTKRLVSNVSFSIDAGKSLALIGESGSGKTIIACSIMGLLPSNVISKELSVKFNDVLISKKNNIRSYLGSVIVYIPQSGHESLNPSKTIKGQFIDSLKRNKISKDKYEEIMLNRLERVGLKSDVLDKYPFELSGGMAQRVVIAFATITNPKLIIADEPTNGLDNESKRDIVWLLNELFPDSAKLVITHDLEVAGCFDEVIVLSKGIELERGKAYDVLSHPNHPYTKSLTSSLIENGMISSPKLREEKGLCPFYSRCPKAFSVCLEKLDERKYEEVRWYCNARD